ncbi:MAG TPA: NADH-quinone oxidoreductase subunit NuoF [Gaiellaceae bacterium]|nr:NADH-quinone oxidoreductase subunit NuoF [Gaiellaceae bacterium]
MAEVHEVLLAGTDEHDLRRLDEYRAIGGYRGVEKARAMTSDALIEELQAANLRGRGGAGFPMGRKASLIDRKSPKPKYLVVNADESEPGAFKDREVMAKVPHRLIEGCLIAAHAIESTDVFIYIRGEYLTEYEILAAAVDEAREAGIFGDVTITVHRGAGAYICGEETALLESLEGKRGQPRPRPPFPPIQGLYAAPTQINNVCTIATVPMILEMGAAEFAKTGVPSSPGTAIFSVSGNVVRPGNYELDLGTPMRELIYEHAGGIAAGRELKAVIPGGSSVPALTPDQIDVPLDYDSLGAIGTFFGAASLIVVDDRCCMVQLALRSTKFYAHESCGKCTPCRVGTRWMVQILESIENGTATLADLELLDSVGDNILGKVLCALGEFAVYPVASYLDKWRDEFVAHIEHGGCPFEGSSSLDGIVAPSDQHAHTPAGQEALV